MGTDTIIDISDSAYAFEHTVFPKLKSEGFIDGEIIPVESVTDSDMAKKLDTQAGIDAWIIKSKKGITGLASRVQPYLPHYKYFPFNTFTVRKNRTSGAKTELEKRIEAINSNGELIYPYFTCQAYITERRIGDLISVGMARTIDIIEMIMNESCDTIPNSSDGNLFNSVKWETMIAKGYELKVWINGRLF